MFLDLREFCRAVLARRPSVALVTWSSQETLESFLVRVGPALRKQQRDTIVVKLACADFDSVLFQERLLAILTGRNVGRQCLLVYQLEPLASAAATILNGYRERLASLRAVVIVIRANRRADFITACPDLMDWVGTYVTRAEDLAPPLTLGEVDALIHSLEKRSKMPTKEFRAKWPAGEIQATDEHWLWNELLAIRSAMKAARKK